MRARQLEELAKIRCRTIERSIVANSSAKRLEFWIRGRVGGRGRRWPFEGLLAARQKRVNL